MDDIINRIETDFRKFSDEYDIFPAEPDFHQYAADRISNERVQEQWDQLLALTTCIVSGSKILEVGSGYGAFINFADNKGLLAYGIEPELSQANISKDFLTLNGSNSSLIINSVGEKIPFPSNYFDVVYSSNVLEHVMVPKQVVSEAIRVLKPRGYLQFVIPNFGSWYDGHYQIVWIPNMPKWLAKFYVRLYKRNTDYLDTLQLLNRPWLERILDRHEENIEIIGWGEEIWENRMRTTFSAWSGLGTLAKIMHLINVLNLEPLIIWAGKHLHWETPLILTLRKRR